VPAWGEFNAANALAALAAAQLMGAALTPDALGISRGAAAAGVLHREAG
jgi:UDP-N-acetylmuramyl pentapeptide synthase